MMEQEVIFAATTVTVPLLYQCLVRDGTVDTGSLQYLKITIYARKTLSEFSRKTLSEFYNLPYSLISSIDRNLQTTIGSGQVDPTADFEAWETTTICKRNCKKRNVKNHALPCPALCERLTARHQRTLRDKL
jgi:hypothetical protein